MPNYIDHKITARASREFRRVATGKTDIVLLDNGDEIRNARWKHKKLKFSASYVMLSPEAQHELISAFYAANAQLLLFRFRDYGDFQTVKSPLTVAQGTKTPVQLTKRYQFGPTYADRMIQAIASCVVYDAGGNVVTGVVDDVLGLFTPDQDWGVGQYTWSGKFDCWVRFASDEFDMTLKTLDLATSDIELIEMRARR